MGEPKIRSTVFLGPENLLRCDLLRNEEYPVLYLTDGSCC